MENYYSTVIYYMVKVFTMVKGEADIVEDWVLYHGDLFGFRNIYVIDNYSKDGTYEILIQLKVKYGINVYRFPDYKKKGNYMTLLLRLFGKGELVFPIDIDEFIVYYDKPSNNIICDNSIILNHIYSLPKLPFYKMNYIIAKMLVPTGYSRATVESELGAYSNYGSQGKTFFDSALFKGTIDHGNHYNQGKFYLSNLCLVHFHERNLEQIKKKTYNNVLGLGFKPFDLRYLENICRPDLMGYHHVDRQIKILKKQFVFHVDTRDNSDIILKPLADKIHMMKYVN